MMGWYGDKILKQHAMPIGKDGCTSAGSWWEPYVTVIEKLKLNKAVLTNLTIGLI